MKFYTVEEAAAILRLKPSTLYGLVHQRRIGYRKHGSRLIFTDDHLEAFSSSNESLPLADQPFRKGRSGGREVMRVAHQKTTAGEDGSLKTEQRGKRKPSLILRRNEDGY